MKRICIYGCNDEKTMYVCPVIFIPGIMGTKLQNAKTGDRAWEPDDELGWGGGQAAKFAAGKRKRLIGPPTQDGFNPNFLKIYYDEDDAKENEEYRKKHPHLKDDHERIKEWSGIMQSCYGAFLRSLEGFYYIKENEWYYARVYVHPYNWTCSNKDSAAELAKTVDFAITDTKRWVDSVKTDGILFYASEPHSSPVYTSTAIAVKPIILTHSMGGLVARGYTQSDNRGNAGKIAGVLHVAMPTDGSPAAYANMLAGSNNTNLGRKHVFGANQREVTATAGNMPGALELLPNHTYKDSKGRKATRTDSSSGWLQVYNQDGSISFSMPNPMPHTDPDYRAPKKGENPDGDPYKQIYLNQKDWWRLIYKEYLNPHGDKDKAFLAFRRSLLNARKFHIQINKHGKFHPNTRMVYSAGTPEQFQACEIVRWKLTKGKFTPPANARLSNDNEGKMAFKIDEYNQPNNTNSGAGGHSVTLESLFELNRLTAAGDGTVHIGSAKYEKGPRIHSIVYHTGAGFDHQDAFKDSEVNDMVKTQLKYMVEDQIESVPAA